MPRKESTIGLKKNTGSNRQYWSMNSCRKPDLSRSVLTACNRSGNGTSRSEYFRPLILRDSIRRFWRLWGSCLPKQPPCQNDRLDPTSSVRAQIACQLNRIWGEQTSCRTPLRQRAEKITLAAHDLLSYWQDAVTPDGDAWRGTTHRRAATGRWTVPARHSRQRAAVGPAHSHHQ